MTVIVIDQPELVFVEVWDALTVLSTATPDASVVEIITATEPVTVETVPASAYLELVENALRGPSGPAGPAGPPGPPGQAVGEAVVTWPTGAEPPLAGVPDGTLWVEYTP